MKVKIINRYFIKKPLKELITSKGMDYQKIARQLNWTTGQVSQRINGKCAISQVDYNDLCKLLEIPTADTDKYFTPWKRLEKPLSEEDWEALAIHEPEELKKLIHLRNVDGRPSPTALKARKLLNQEEIRRVKKESIIIIRKRRALSELSVLTAEEKMAYFKHFISTHNAENEILYNKVIAKKNRRQGFELALGFMLHIFSLDEIARAMDEGARVCWQEIQQKYPKEAKWALDNGYDPYKKPLDY